MIKQYINGRKCSILGLGVSNMPLCRLLCDLGVSVSVYDKSTPEELGYGAFELQERGVHFEKAGREFDGIDGELVFRSPGIRPDRAGLVAARERGAEITGETELLLKLTRAHTYGVTGSDGKTTSTTLTGKFLACACDDSGVGRTYVGGNIGTPLLTLCEDMTENDNAVLELSSFQLMTLTDAPECVAITNISPNHLDWHTGMDEYISAKKNIIGANTKRFVTNAECAETLKLAAEVARDGMELVLFSSSKCEYAQFEGLIGKGRECTAIFADKEGYITVCTENECERVLAVSDIHVPGKHNVENFMTAIGLTYGFVPSGVYKKVADGFFGVEHRLELVRTHGGVEYYNSSIDSTPTRTAAALSAMSGRSIVLICGGYDKHIPYAPLAEVVCTHGGVHTLVLTGDTAEVIDAAMKKYMSEHGANVNTVRTESFEQAVEAARRAAKEGDAVLLSPASASFDMFKNFAERGKRFKELVGEL